MSALCGLPAEARLIDRSTLVKLLPQRSQSLEDKVNTRMEPIATVDGATC